MFASEGGCVLGSTSPFSRRDIESYANLTEPAGVGKRKTAGGRAGRLLFQFGRDGQI